jgi:hypothetical protein
MPRGIVGEPPHKNGLPTTEVVEAMRENEFHLMW